MIYETILGVHMMKTSILTAFLLLPLQSLMAEPLESTSAFYSEKPMVYVSPTDRVQTFVFTVNPSPISDNVTITTVKRDKEHDSDYMYSSKFVYCLVEKDINSIHAESSVKKTCINEYGEGTEKIVNDTKLDLTKVRYLEYPIPAGKKLDYFSLQPVEMGKPILDYIKLAPNEKKRAYLIYGFTPSTGEIKQNIMYILK